jgi:hypothetical protein
MEPHDIFELTLYASIGIDIVVVIYNLIYKFLKDGYLYLFGDACIYTIVFYLLYTHPFTYGSLTFLIFMVHYSFLLLVVYNTPFTMAAINGDKSSAIIKAKLAIGITTCPFRKITSAIDYNIFSAVFRTIGCLLLLQFIETKSILEIW